MIESIYANIDIEKDELSKKEVKEYKNKVSMAKNILFENKIPKKVTFEDLCEIMRYIVEDIDHFDVDEFDSAYSTKTLRKLGVKNLTESIIANASDEIKVRCGFESKRIIISSVWNDYYDKHYDRITAENIFYCSGDLKAGLMRAAKSKLDSVLDGQDSDSIGKSGKYNKEKSSKAKTVHGNLVDGFIYKHLTDFIELNASTSNFVDKLVYLANIQDEYKQKQKSMPGLFEIIKERGCYSNPLDFYMFNSPEEVQLFYLDDYMEIREKKYGLEDEVGKMIKEIYDSYIGMIESTDYDRY